MYQSRTCLNIQHLLSFNLTLVLPHPFGHEPSWDEKTTRQNSAIGISHPCNTHTLSSSLLCLVSSIGRQKDEKVWGTETNKMAAKKEDLFPPLPSTSLPLRTFFFLGSFLCRTHGQAYMTCTIEEEVENATRIRSHALLFSFPQILPRPQCSHVFWFSVLLAYDTSDFFLLTQPLFHPLSIHR